MENPIIENKGDLILSSSVENLGGGRVLAIKSYYLGLYDFQLKEGADQSCMEGANVPVPSQTKLTKQTIHLRTCLLSGMSAELSNPTDFVFKEYEAVLEYDYQIQKEVPLEIKEVNLGTEEATS